MCVVEFAVIYFFVVFPASDFVDDEQNDCIEKTVRMVKAEPSPTVSPMTNGILLLLIDATG